MYIIVDLNNIFIKFIRDNFMFIPTFATKWQYILAQWQSLGAVIIEIDMRPARAILLFCPCRAHISYISNLTQGFAIGLYYNWLTANKSLGDLSAYTNIFISDISPKTDPAPTTNAKCFHAPHIRVVLLAE